MKFSSEKKTPKLHLEKSTENLQRMRIYLIFDN